MLAYKEQHGAESVVLGYGTGRENESVIYRFANYFGSPNVLTAGHFCYGPRIATTVITCGSNVIVDYDNNPALHHGLGQQRHHQQPRLLQGRALLPGAERRGQAHRRSTPA